MQEKCKRNAREIQEKCKLIIELPVIHRYTKKYRDTHSNNAKSGYNNKNGWSMKTMQPKPRPYTDDDLARLEPEGRAYSLPLGKGLRVFVLANGQKKFKAKVNGRLVLIGLFPALTLAEAHEVLKERRGGAQSPTVKVVAEKFIEKKRIGGSGVKNLIRFNGLLKNHILPEIGNIPISHLRREDIARVLENMVAKSIIDSAYRASDCIHSMMEMAIGLGLINVNPARATRTLLPMRNKTQSFDAVTDHQHFGRLLHKIESCPGLVTLRHGLSLMAHLFLRPSELRGLRWDYLDINRNLIILPPGYTKNGILREVPLSPPVREIIKNLYSIRSLNPQCPWILSCNGKTPVSDTALRNRLKLCIKDGLGDGLVDDPDTRHSLHGFRASARTIIREQLGFERDTIEHQLDHVPADNNRTAYNRTQLLNDRVRMMNEWSHWIVKAQEAAMVTAPGRMIDDDAMEGWV